jgi:hypothetical protein
VLTGSHHLHRLLLERDRLARGEGAARDVGPLTDLDKFAGVDAVLELALGRRDGEDTARAGGGGAGITRGLRTGGQI